MLLVLWQPSEQIDATSNGEPLIVAAAWEIAFVHPVGPEFVEATYGQRSGWTEPFSLFANTLQVKNTY